jgi:hypothetical protein
MSKPDETKKSIIDELHLTRQQLLKEHGGIAGLAKYLRDQEAASGTKTVSALPTVEPLQTRSRSK